MFDMVGALVVPFYMQYTICWEILPHYDHLWGMLRYSKTAFVRMDAVGMVFAFFSQEARQGGSAKPCGKNVMYIPGPFEGVLLVNAAAS